MEQAYAAPLPTKPQRLLLIEDDEKTCHLLKKFMGQHGYEVIAAPSGEGIGEKIDLFKPCCILLDWMIPGAQNGLEVCQSLRARGYTTPVIFTTARSELECKLDGFDAGADDFLTKPFNPLELVARLKSVLRRSAALLPPAAVDSQEENTSAKFLLNPLKRNLAVDGREIELSETEYVLLEFLAKNPGVVVTRNELTLETRGVEWRPGDRYVDMAISRLRLKLNDPERSPRFIKTVRGTGYLFMAKTE